VEREQARLHPPVPPAETLELRGELARAARRRDAVVLGAALMLGALVWLAVARDPAWLGWALLAAGAAAGVHGLWRSS
jgi:hypothetical protein